MDKRALQSYAVWAKNNLESQIEVSLKTLGINSEKDIKEARKVGDYTIIDGDSNSYPGDLKEKRDSIVKLITTDGYKQVIEEIAYTWFNRIVALRFMEVHDFLPHGFRVLSSRDGGVEPEIMKHLDLVKDELKLDLSVIQPLCAQGKLDEAYSYVLFRQCRALSGILPMLFDRDQDYLELLLPKALLKGDTFITKLMEIGEDDFLNDVEVIGWLYQFYISQKKDEVFASKEIITKDTLPAVTQLFTPDWIVRYMVENSVGRIWLESYPNSALKSQMKYYVDDAKQEASVQQKIDAIKYKNVSPEEIKIIEPCCGSGHILVYVFDLLYKMYEERGYQSREIPTLILKNNLVGLDVDKRAAQLASFSLIMKARTMNSRFFNDNYYVKPSVYEIWDARELLQNNYEQQLVDLKILSNEEIKEVKWLVETFRYGKTIGSLLKVKKTDFSVIERAIQTIKTKAVLTIFNSNLLNNGVRCLEYLLSQAKVMSAKYDVMITNPPYIGISSMEKPVKDYASVEYPDSKTDMFAMFMEVPYVKKNGFRAMINMHSWMFLSSYEKLRKKIIMNEMIVNMLHLGAHAFEMIGGEVVQTTAFVLRNSPIATNGVYFRLVDEKDKEAAFLAGGGIIMNLSVYEALPSNIIAYWVSKNFIDVFINATSLINYGEPRQGLATSDNNRFLREWFEVNINNECFNATDSIYAVYTGKKWFPYNKGGDFRKWYGNQEHVVNWSLNGKEIRSVVKNGKIASRVQNSQYYFNESISWSKVSGCNIAFRYYPKGFLFDVAGCSLFIEDEEQRDYIFGLINTKMMQYILKALSPTLNYEVGQVASIPVIESKDHTQDVIVKVKDNIKNSKEEWDEFETSWNFKKHPLI